MILKNKHIRDVAKIMGVEEAMVGILPKLQSTTKALNPWVRQFPGIFRGLKLKGGTRVLDIPCGQGGVSVPLAKKYKVRVVGFDVLPEYVRNANKLAIKQGVGNLCKFKIQDIREVIRKRNICDVLLWVAQAHQQGQR